MNIIFFLVIITVYSFDCEVTRSPYPEIPNDYTLKYVQTVARHGDRSPTNSYEGDSSEFICNAYEESHIYLESGSKVSHSAAYKKTVIDKEYNFYAEDYFWKGSCESGQLTPKGISQLHKNGKAFDEIYRKKLQFLPKIFDPNKIKFRTTGKIRTFHSAQAFAQTFYPIERRGVNVDIEFVSQPYDIETMKPNSDCCPIIPEVEKKIMEEVGIEAMRNEEPFKSSFEKLKRITGYHTSLNYIYNYVDLLHPLVCHNQSFPCKDNECMTYEDYEILLEENNKENKYFFREDLARFQVGFFLNEMLQDYDEALEKGILFQYYSGHDTTILPLLSLLKQNLNIRVPYASTLVFEFFENNEIMYVRVLFNNDLLDLSSLCAVNEDDFCTVEDFKSTLQSKIPTIEECEQTSKNTLKKDGRKQKRPISRYGWGTYN